MCGKKVKIIEHHLYVKPITPRNNSLIYYFTKFYGLWGLPKDYF